MKQTGKRIGSLLLSVCMVFTMLSPIVSAETGEVDSGALLSTGKTITTFEPFAAEVSTQTVESGTLESQLSLPDTLTVTLTAKSDDATATDSGMQEETQTTVTVSVWVSDPAYDGDKSGAYIFTPTLDLPAGLTVAVDVNVPQISVTVGKTAVPMLRAAKSPQITGGSSGDVNDGVDLTELINPDNGIYYGTYVHVTGLSSGDFGAVTASEGFITPILWNVMGEENGDGNITLLSKYVLDSKPLNNGFYGANVQNYADSALHTWLNGAFLNSFQPAEQSGIADTSTITGMYDFYNGNPITGDYYPRLAYKDSGDLLENNNTVKQINTGPWPKMTTDDKVYLPWGISYGASVYWTAGDNTSEGNLSNKIATLKNGTPVRWRLRSPFTSNSFMTLAVSSSGTVASSNLLGGYGLRPAFKLKPSEIVFASEIKSGADEIKGETPSGTYYAASEGAKNFKLTVADSASSDTLAGVPTDTQSVTSNSNLSLNNLTPSQTGGVYTVSYKIVGGSGTREVVAYGSVAAAVSTNLTLATSSLSAGSYDAYVWLQKNNTIFSREASAVQHFGITIASADATAPNLSAGSVSRTSDTEAEVAFTTSEAGEAFYTVVNSGAAAPTKETVAGGSSLGSVSGIVTNKSVTLTAGAKDIYIVVKDAANNLSEPLKIETAAYVFNPAQPLINKLTGLGFTVTVNGSIVTVSGSKTGVTQQVSLDIPSGVTVRWGAELTGTVEHMAILSVANEGILEIVSGAKLSNTASIGMTLDSYKAGSLIILDGEISCTGNFGHAISVRDGGNCVIKGGTVSPANSANVYQLRLDGALAVIANSASISAITTDNVEGASAVVRVAAGLSSATIGSAEGLTVTPYNLETGDSLTTQWLVRDDVSGINVLKNKSSEYWFASFSGVTIHLPLPTAPNITTGSLPNGRVGMAYSQTLAADMPVTWSVDSGSLPAGLTLNTSTGVISGIPASSGTFNFTVKATKGANSNNKALSITIDPVLSPTKYNVTVNNGTASPTPAEAGTGVTITANTAPNGKRFKKWTVQSGGVALANASAVSTTFTMPASVVEVTSTYEDIPAGITPATGITVNPTTCSLYSNTSPSKVILDAVVAPANATDKTVTWQSNKPSVARVDSNGEITAVGNGTALITATTNDGGYTASCTVTVTTYTSGNNGGDSGNGDNGGGFSSSTTATSDKQPDQPVTAAIPLTATVGASGTANASIPDKAVTDAIAKAQADLKAQGKTANGTAVALNVTMPQGATSLTATLTRNSLNSLVRAGITSFEINGSPVSVRFDKNVLKEILRQNSGTMIISITPQANLSASARAMIGTRPVYNITVGYGSGRRVSGFGGGTAAMAIPYKPAKGEAVGALYAVYVDDRGNATRIAGSIYDANAGAILFPVTHLSVYGVGYTAPSAKLTDISTHWGKESIDYVVGRGLLAGTSETAFSPDTAMTRGMLVTALGRLANIDTKVYTANSFTDVKADSAFCPYIEWSYKKGIMQSIGSNQFAPGRVITREEIALIFANYAKATGYTLPVAREATTYVDNSSIGSAYQAAVKAMQQAGIMVGGSGNRFNPKGNATRAEVSAMLHRYIKLIIDPATAQGWALNDAGQHFYYKDGKALTGWQTIDGAKYYFNADGSLA